LAEFNASTPLFFTSTESLFAVLIKTSASSHPLLIASLTALSANNIMSIFHDLNENHKMTIVQVTHDMNVANHGGKIFRILDGLMDRVEILKEKVLA